MNLKRIIPTLTIALLLTGCGNGNENVESSSSDVSTPVSATSNDSVSEEESSPAALEASESTASESSDSESAASESATSESSVSETVSLSNEELAEFTALFNTPEYYGFVSNPYNNVDEIEWTTVLENGAGINITDISEEEIEDFKTYETYYFNYTDVQMTDSEIEEKIKELDSYEYEQLTGTMDYSSFVQTLEN